MGIFPNSGPSIRPQVSNDDTGGMSDKVQGVLKSLVERRKSLKNPMEGSGGDTQTTPLPRSASLDELAHPAGKNFLGFKGGK